MNLARIVDAHPDAATALLTPAGAAWTYRDLRAAVAAERGRLAAAGVVPGDRVALIAANEPAFVVAYLAVLGAGAVAVPLNVMSPVAELRRQLDQVDVALVLVGPAAAHVAGLVEALAGTPVRKVAPEPPGAGVEGAPGGPTPPVADRAPGDPAALLFTAGTAGAARAAVLTHDNLLSNLEQARRHPGWAVEAADRVFGVLPFCHIFGLNTVLGGTLYIGASVVLVDRFEPARALALVAQQQVTIVVGAPSLFAALAAAPGPAGDDRPLRRVRLAFSGAAPLPPDVAAAWEDRGGSPLRQGYGLTEASPIVTLSAEPGRPTSVGVPLPGVEVRLVDGEGEDALAGDPGEIWVRGPNVFAGYWRDPAATEAVLGDDGWLRTGDIGVVSDAGELAIVDRAKDLIIVSGFNVYPAEVEETLAEHPRVADVAVVGEPDRTRGEAVHAFVVRAGEVTEADLTAWCGARLARYKCPTDYTWVDSLPHGLAGKLLRRALRSGRTPVA